MKYAKALGIHMRHYPTLYLNESDLLDQLFFTNGNGLDWFNGALVDVKYNPKTGKRRAYTEKELDKANERHQEVLKRQRAETRAFSEELRASVKKIVKDAVGSGAETTLNNVVESLNKLEDDQDTVEYWINYRNRCIDMGDDCWFRVEGEQDPRVFGHKMYPICEYAKIMNLPDDIKPDWLEAAERAVAWAESPYCKMTDSDRAFLELAKARIRKLRLKRGPGK